MQVEKGFIHTRLAGGKLAANLSQQEVFDLGFRGNSPDH